MKNYLFHCSLLLLLLLPLSSRAGMCEAELSTATIEAVFSRGASTQDPKVLKEAIVDLSKILGTRRDNKGLIHAVIDNNESLRDRKAQVDLDRASHLQPSVDRYAALVKLQQENLQLTAAKLKILIKRADDLLPQEEVRSTNEFGQELNRIKQTLQDLPKEANDWR